MIWIRVHLKIHFVWLQYLTQRVAGVLKLNSVKYQAPIPIKISKILLFA
jgi:hypothetical protein